LQVFHGDAETHLSQKYYGFCAGLIQLPDGRFHIGRTINFQRSIHPDDPAGRTLDQGNGIQRGRFYRIARSLPRGSTTLRFIWQI